MSGNLAMDSHAPAFLSVHDIHAYYGESYIVQGVSFNETGDGAPAAEAELADLEQFYRKAKARFDEDPTFASLSRETVVKLQQGDPACRAAWQRFIDVSLSHCEALYGRLQVTLTREHVHAESAYNDALPGVIAALRDRGLLTESEGAQCVFLEEFKGKDDAPLPLIVQKSDGGYLYATTDLAAVRYRCDDLEADRALYLVDKRDDANSIGVIEWLCRCLHYFVKRSHRR